MSQPATARPHLCLYFVKVCCLLLCVSAPLLAPHPARAQRPSIWQAYPCDAHGNPDYNSPDSNGFYTMSGTESVNTANSYPAPMISAALASPRVYGGYLGAGFPLDLYVCAGSPQDLSPLPFSCAVTGNGSGLGSWSSGFFDAQAGNYAYNGYNITQYSVPASFGSPNSGPINGSVTVDLDGQLVLYFNEQWMGDGPPTIPMPDHLDLLIRTGLTATAGITYDPSASPSGVPSGLYAAAMATDGPPFNETATASAGAPPAGTAAGGHSRRRAQPPAGTAAGPGSVVGYHVVRAAVDPVTRIAEVYLSGQTHLVASDMAPYQVGAQTDPSSALAHGLITGGVKIPGYGSLNGTYINKDLPTNTTYQALPNPLVLYGGSVRSTSDELLLNAADPNPIPGTTYTWYAYGAGGYAPPPGGPIWNVVIPASSGIDTFQCLVQPPGAEPTMKILNVEVGVRTDDTIMVGWIDANGVPISPVGVDAPVVADLPPGLGTGKPGSDPLYPFNPVAATARLFALSQNNDFLDYLSLSPSQIYTQLDKDYILDWMFKYAPNPDPTPTLLALGSPDATDPTGLSTTPDLTTHAGYMDYPKLQAYLADPHRFKLFNHFQVKYRVDAINPALFNGPPTMLQQGAIVGATVNPTGLPPDFGPILNTLSQLPFPFNVGPIEAAWANHTLLDPQAGPANGLIGPVPATDHISQCNDGSPEIPAIRAFNTLTGLGVANPLFWQNIGSKITFNCGVPAPTPINENYPTYYIYQNGLLVKVVKQAKTPNGHFYANPYPFGTDPSYGLPPQGPGQIPMVPGLPCFPTIPGGRNGLATLPGDTSSSTPAYTVP